MFEEPEPVQPVEQPELKVPGAERSEPHPDPSIDTALEAALVEAGLSKIEAKIANDALEVMNSAQFSLMVTGHTTGTAEEAKIGQFIVLYQPDLPD